LFSFLVWCHHHLYVQSRFSVIDDSVQVHHPSMNRLRG
jgi:hypothetical protein